MTAPAAFLYGNAISDALRASRSIATDSPAATRKMLGFATALQAAGVRATLISMGRGRPGAPGWHRGHREQIGGIPLEVLPFVSPPMISQALSVLFIAIAAWRNARAEPGAVHIFYNRLTLYLPALMVLRALGRKCTIDIEDGAIESKSSGRPKRAFSTSPAKLFDRLARHNAIIANEGLKNATAVRPVTAFYGIASARASSEREWFGDTFEVLMSGSIFPETGADLLLAAIVRLKERAEHLRIHVTGAGPSLEHFAKLNGQCGPVAVTVHHRLSHLEYERLLDRVHVGLSLKLLGSALAGTTFPSKTVEYAEHGLLLIATDISDVRKVFGDTALYLDRDDPGELAELIAGAARDRRRSRDMAAAAQRRIAEQLSPQAQGARLRRFLFGDEE